MNQHSYNLRSRAISKRYRSPSPSPPRYLLNEDIDYHEENLLPNWLNLSTISTSLSTISIGFISFIVVLLAICMLICTLIMISFSASMTDNIIISYSGNLLGKHLIRSFIRWHTIGIKIFNTISYLSI